MKRMLTFVLTLIVLTLGALIVFASPADPLAIIIGMVLVSMAILNLAVQIYFPPVPEQTVDLKVVEEPIKPKEIKTPERVEKPRKVVKGKKKR